FFLPDADTGEGLSNLDYAFIANELGKSPLASETLNCSAPDTGNMEVLERVGTPEQKEKWLKPLLNGEIRSAFAMTEPAV
ncbi:MAG TPA: acyl-CoA dehydrogenase, partial [Gammaproteobacteria bacterium]|nr:acyl-CoA dehydrogenase [Gammaproteobacteria bacterium]